VLVPEPAEYVARGAAVQAAAVLAGRDVAEVARDWSPSDVRDVEPNRSVDTGAVRAAYRAARSERMSS